MGCEKAIGPNGIESNLAPDAFRRWSYQYIQCEAEYSPPSGLSPVPFFLLSRAIELAIKAEHLTRMTQEQVKFQFSHNLCEAYNALPANKQILGSEEITLLQKINTIYAKNGFEYFDPSDAGSGYYRFPNLASLRLLAKKLLP